MAPAKYSTDIDPIAYILWHWSIACMSVSHLALVETCTHGLDGYPYAFLFYMVALLHGSTIMFVNAYIISIWRINHYCVVWWFYFNVARITSCSHSIFIVIGFDVLWIDTLLIVVWSPDPQIGSAHTHDQLRGVYVTPD